MMAIKTIDIDKGRFTHIPRPDLFIDYTYQRRHNDSEPTLRKIRTQFDPKLFGSLMVADYGKGFPPCERYAIVDGGTRFIGSEKISGYDLLPCLVYEVESPEEAARLFQDFQKNRKNLTTLEIHHASIAAKDPVAVEIQRIFDDNGIVAKPGGGALYCCSMSLCRTLVKKDPRIFETTVKILAKICEKDKYPVTQNLLNGVFYLLKNVKGLDKPEQYKIFYERICKVGAIALQERTMQLARAFIKGDKQISEGLLDIINKKCRIRFELKDQPQK